MPPELFGPFGVAVGAVAIAVALWREHLKADERERQNGDRALAGWEAQTGATKDLAAEMREWRAERRGRDQSD